MFYFRANMLKPALISVLLFILLAPVHSGAASGEDCRFRFSLGTEPPTLDPSLATDGTSILVIENLMEGLTQFDQNLLPVPAVAKKWEVSKDGKTWLFYLREDVHWSDGKKVTADDFEYSWKRLLNPETASEYAYFLYDLENAEAYNQKKISGQESVGVKALSPFLLRVRLVKPVVYFPSLTVFSGTVPLRRDLIEKYGDHWTDPEKMVVNGPYRLKEWRHEYKLTLEKNRAYYGGEVLCGTVEAFIINERSTALTLYETGSLDMVFLTPEAIPSYRNDREYVNQPLLRGYYYGFNTRVPPFNDSRVRRAFSMAIDRSELPRILSGGEVPAKSWIPPGMFAHDPSIGLDFNPMEAARQLAEAGYPGGKRFPSVRLAFNTDAVNGLVAENIQAQIKRNLNITLSLDNMEWKVYLKKLQLDTPAVFRLSWGADYPDPDNFMNLFITGGGNNHTGWGNPRYDRLISEAAADPDPASRRSKYGEAQKILTETDAAIIPLFFSAQNLLVRRNVHGFIPNAMELFSFKTVWKGDQER